MRPTRHYTVFLCEDSSGDELSQDDEFISALPDHFLLFKPFEWSIVSVSALKTLSACPYSLPVVNFVKSIFRVDLKYDIALQCVNEI